MGTDEQNKKTFEIYNQLENIESLKELMSCPNSPLLTIAALAQDFFEEIDYIDEEIDVIDFNKSYDVVAMSFMTQQASRAFELASAYRDMGTFLIAGGMHPTNSPDETGRYFNTIFIGEAEETWFEFINDYQNNRTKKIYRNKSVIDMDKVPVPLYELLKMDCYRTIPLQISRGCPHDCEFCASTKVYGPKYRHKSVERVLNEIEVIKALKPLPHIYFTDDNMLVKRSFNLNLLDAITGGGFRWMTHTDVSIANQDDILKRLYASGCRKLVIGFESIVPDSLQKLEKWKYDRLDFYEEAIDKIQSQGIGVWGTFIVGLDGDDRSVFDRVIQFCIKNHLYGAMISVPTPFPGSRLFETLENDGRILTKHWGSYTLWNVVMKPLQMTIEELETGFERTLREIYSKSASTRRLEYFKQIYLNMRKRH